MQITFRANGSTLRTNYWGSSMERSGEYSCCVERGTIHLLLHRRHTVDLEKCEKAKYVIVTTGPVPEQKAANGIQFLFEDYSAKPYALLLTALSCKNIPRELAVNCGWQVSVWLLRNGQPHRAICRAGICRRSESLPDFFTMGIVLEENAMPMFVSMPSS